MSLLGADWEPAESLLGACWEPAVDRAPVGLSPIQRVAAPPLSHATPLRSPRVPLCLAAGAARAVLACLRACWEPAGSLVGACWERACCEPAAGSLLGACWEPAGSPLGACREPAEPAGSLLGAC